MKGLTEREYDVAKLVTLGLDNKEIGLRLHISVHTVKAVLEHIYENLGLDNRVQLAVMVTKFQYEEEN